MKNSTASSTVISKISEMFCLYNELLTSQNYNVCHDKLRKAHRHQVKVHFNFDDTIPATASQRPPTLKLKRPFYSHEPWLHLFGQTNRECHQNTSISRWITSWCSTNWTLVNVNNLFNGFITSDAFVFPGFIGITI